MSNKALDYGKKAHMIKVHWIEQKIAICRFKRKNRPVRPEPAGPDITNCSSIYLGNYLLFLQKFPWKNVWHDAPVQLFETETVQNEYDGDGQPDDALPHET